MMMKRKENRSARLVLAHINDTHSYFEPTSLQLTLEVDDQPVTPYVSAGGFARIATRAHQLRDDAKRMNSGFLFLHAGDCFQGTLYFSLFKGKANAEMLNALEIDAMALGNHELDMGNEPVAKFVQKVNFPLLAGNWDLSRECQSKPYTLRGVDNVYDYAPNTETAKWIIKEVDGEPIAIFGLSLDKMSDISNPDADTPFVNAEKTARKTISALNALGVNKIILLSHLGYDADLELAEKVSGLSLIIGGHSHHLQGDFSDIGLGRGDEYGLLVNGTRVLQAGFHSLTMGHAYIDFAADGTITKFVGKNELLLGRRLFLNASMSQVGEDSSYHQACELLNNHNNVVVCKKDPDVHKILADKYIPRVRKLQSTIIATNNQPLRHIRIPDAQGPSEVAPLVCESFYYAMNKRQYDVQFAIHNAGGVRTSLNEGDITVADVAGKLLPFAVPIGMYQVTGATLALVLEGAINNAFNNGVEGTGSGSYPYTHNLNFEYIADAPMGSRVTNLQIYNEETGWEEVQPEQIYRGASSAYTMKGKEGFDAIVNVESDPVVTNLSMADCFIELLTDQRDRLNQSSHMVNSVWHKGC